MLQHVGSNFRHGKSDTIEYRTWAAMIQRCTNVNDPRYVNYGGRGITFDPAWRFFENFYKDMGDKPVGTSLERINNNGNYEKSNCRWATVKEQSRNRRSNVSLTFKGKTKLIVEWAELYKIHPNTLKARLLAGWAIERALTEKVHKKRARRIKWQPFQ